MPHDPEFIAETRSWLLKAHTDIRLAEIVQREDASLYGDALFHCQQAAEKSLKGFLTWHGRTFRKTHSIGELGQAVVEIAPNISTSVRPAAVLTEYAWKFRYPGDVPEVAAEEIEAALQLARSLYGAIVAALPVDVHP